MECRGRTGSAANVLFLFCAISYASSWQNRKKMFGTLLLIGAAGCIVMTALATVLLFMRASYSNYPGAAALLELHESQRACNVGMNLAHALS